MVFTFPQAKLMPEKFALSFPIENKEFKTNSANPNQSGSAI
jgi:hypothetical protein